MNQTITDVTIQKVPYVDYAKKHFIDDFGDLSKSEERKIFLELRRPSVSISDYSKSNFDNYSIHISHNSSFQEIQIRDREEDFTANIEPLVRVIEEDEDESP